MTDIVVSPTETIKTIDAALAIAKGGDNIVLSDGNYPAIRISKAFEVPVTIKSGNSKKARIASVDMAATAKGITLKDLCLWRDPASPGYAVRALPGSANITVENNDVRAIEDSINYLKWDLNQWLSIVGETIWLRGTNSVVRRNKVTGVGQGINVSGGGVVEENVIDGFAWDGLRGQGNSVFRRNLVKNCFKVDATHRDGFQSYSSSDVIGLTYEENVILSWAHSVSHALRGDCQGISLFDGMYIDLIIRNNIVGTDHYNGLTVLGTTRAQIYGNTVVNISGKAGTAPWLKVGAHKDGRASTAVECRDNKANSFSGVSGPNNVVVTDPTAVLLASGALSFNPLGAAPTPVPVPPPNPTPTPIPDPTPTPTPVPTPVTEGSIRIPASTKETILTWKLQ